MLSNAYFLAKFRFDAAENEPAKNLRNFAIIFPNLLNLVVHVHVEQDLGVLVEGPERHVPVRVGHRDLREEALGADRPHVREAVGPKLVKLNLRILHFFCNFLAGPFSAVSKQNFARKYAFDSIFQALQDLHPFAPLQSQNFRKKSV